MTLVVKTTFTFTLTLRACEFIPPYVYNLIKVPTGGGSSSLKPPPVGAIFSQALSVRREQK
jgi:hypothetical protein